MAATPAKDGAQNLKRLRVAAQFLLLLLLVLLLGVCGIDSNEAQEGAEATSTDDQGLTAGSGG
jgi:hypothetical protein